MKTMRSWLLVSLSWCLLFSLAPAQEGELINYLAGLGEMEHDDDPSGIGNGIADPYETVFTPTNLQEITSFTIDRDNFVSGVASQKISFSRSAGPAGTIQFQIRPRFPTSEYPQPGQTVTFKFWAKTENWSNTRLRLRLVGFDGNGTTTVLSTMNPAAGWQQYQYTFVMPNSNPPGMRVVFLLEPNEGAASGTLWLDKMELTCTQRWYSRAPRSIKLFCYYKPTTPEANYDWISFAREFDMIGIVGSTVELRRMHEYNPNLKSLTYYDAFYSISTVGPPPAIYDPFWYHFCWDNHRDWFLQTVFGNYAIREGRYLMDIGNPACGKWAADNIYNRMQVANYPLDAIQMDNLNDFAQLYSLIRYPTQASRTAALVKYLTYLHGLLENTGTKIVLNGAGVPYTPQNVHYNLLRRNLLDGILIEGWCFPLYTPRAEAHTFSQWSDHLSSMVDNPGKTFIAYTGYNDDASRRRSTKYFGMASYFLGRHEECYQYLDRHYQYNNPRDQRSWLPDEDYNVPIGEPVAPYQVFFNSADWRGGLYYREYTNGFVLVNPTGNFQYSWKDGAAFNWTLNDTYYEVVTQQTLPAGTRVKLYPKEARIFIRPSALTSGRDGGMRPVETDAIPKSLELKR